MTTRRTLTSTGLVTVVLIGVFLSWRNLSSDHSPGTAPNTPSSNPVRKIDLKEAIDFPAQERPIATAVKDLEGQPALVAPKSGELANEEVPPLIALLGAPATPPDAEPEMVLDLFDVYRRVLGAYPAGEDNRQFVNALLGANKEKRPFIPRDHPRLNAKGEIVDAWGTPFFFHMNSRVSIEVRSAGADRRLFTADDIVAGKASNVSVNGSMPSANDLTDSGVGK